MRKNRIVWGFAVLALAAGLVCMSGSEAFAGKKTPPPYNVLYSFTGGTTDGQYPYGNGLVGSGATLYGMTYYGGSDADTNGYGTIFEVNTLTGKETVLHSFAGGTTDGEYPYGSLTLSGKILYGMTMKGAQTVAARFSSTTLQPKYTRFCTTLRAGQRMGDILTAASLFRGTPFTE